MEVRVRGMGSGVQVFDDGAAQHLARILGVLVRGGTVKLKYKYHAQET